MVMGPQAYQRHGQATIIMLLFVTISSLFSFHYYMPATLKLHRIFLYPFNREPQILWDLNLSLYLGNPVSRMDGSPKQIQRKGLCWHSIEWCTPRHMSSCLPWGCQDHNHIPDIPSPFPPQNLYSQGKTTTFIQFSFMELDTVDKGQNQ